MSTIYFNAMMPAGSDAELFISGYVATMKSIAMIGALAAHREHLLKYPTGRKVDDYCQYLIANGACAALLDSDAA